MILPDGGSADRGVLWNAAEAAEKRKDSRTAREWIVALPAELGDVQRADLARSFGVELGRRHGVAVDVAIHAPDAEGDNRNHHAHILTTTRSVSRGEGGAVVMGEKATIEQSDTKRRAAGLGAAADEVTAIRGLWEQMANAALEVAGRAERIDRRTLAAQGIDREATAHLGPVASDMERRGKVSDRGEGNRQVVANNVERWALVERVVKADVRALAQKPIPELRAEVKRREPPTFKQMAEEHPAIAPTVSVVMRALQGVAWCKQRVQRIGKRVAEHKATRAGWEAEGGLWRGVQKLARRAGAAFGDLAVSDAWLAKQARQRARTEHVQRQREAQITRLAREFRALAEQHRPAIERLRLPLVERHERAVEVLGLVEERLEQTRAEERAKQRATWERTPAKAPTPSKGPSR